MLALSCSSSFLSRVKIVQDSAEHYPNRGNGGEIVRDTEDPRLWRVYWMGEITFPKFPCRVTAFRYLNQLRQGKRTPEQPI